MSTEENPTPPAPTPTLPTEVREAIEDAINKTNNPPFFDRLPKWSEARGELINRLLGNLAPLWRPAPVTADAEVEQLKADLNDANKLYERQRAERQKEIGMQEYRGNTVSYIYDKERAYGAHFDRMSAEIADLRAQLAAQNELTAEYAHTLERQDAQLAAAQADKERLDWLERIKGRAGYSPTTYLGDGYFAHEECQGDKYFAADTLRAAIDAARQIKE